MDDVWENARTVHFQPYEPNKNLVLLHLAGRNREDAVYAVNTATTQAHKQKFIKSGGIISPTMGHPHVVPGDIHGLRGEWGILSCG